METIFIGLFYIAIGVLTKFFPNLIAGYSHLSQREKENAVINGFHKFVMSVFIAMGVLVVAGYSISIWLNNPPLGTGVFVAVTLLGAVIIIVFGSRFTSK
ncbi:uncharacterized protein DUF3784 [Algoriphagus ratkowskyi]|uniref:DUF3784 domain-containing protein n=1 Tax=Algoriphagus ratkowskyi TaxID=57028 RepID=A0A2W7T0Z0_9BACT|nr:DUF3784 domain-containing protein [Algoriphagus ratkowskyi]PZX56832.1 uncharacterized protein DUF3784 [Algoriphagus ratkowskyi]TXD79748.1 DUF3784 domain-containing protein [Algoriphagus ratkowskyi]